MIENPNLQTLSSEQTQDAKRKTQNVSWISLGFVLSALLWGNSAFAADSLAEEPQEETAKAAESTMIQDAQSDEPMVVNADKIEYAKEANKVILSGNVEVTKADTVMTCDKAVINTLTNDAHAEGNVILKDKKGVIKAPSVDYNYKTRTGQAFDAKIAYPPYYGMGKIVKKISEDEIEIKNGYFTTCDKEEGRPHYRIQSRMLQIFPEDKVTAKAMTFRVANTPVMYMPKFTQNLKDDRMHVQVTPGKSKDWGAFILTAWRYDLLNNSGGRVHLDYREKKDVAWGIDNYYDTKAIGKGYFKTYYMNERKLGKKRLYKQPRVLGPTDDKERYRIQWRHKWEVDKNTFWLAEYHKMRDSNFIKDYFLREYEKNSSVTSYILYSHILADSSNLSVLNQKRTNRIFTETEKLPEITLNKPSVRILETPLYISNSISYVNFNIKNAAPSEVDDSNQRIDHNSNLSIPSKISFLDFTPYITNRQTYYKRIVGRDESVLREAWGSGVNMTTRFYRTFEAQTNLWGIEINKLRHIISPAAGYSYARAPTVASSKLIDIDSAGGEANQMSFSLENKLQTKRSGKSNKELAEPGMKTVDFLRLTNSTNYNFNIEGRKRRWDPNVTFDLEMLPYDWLRFETDANLDRKKRYFTSANFDLKADGKGVSWGGGYRYERKSSSQMTGEILFNLIKGWSFKVYQRLQFKGNSLVKEQDYVISKELHCWILNIQYNVLRERGETILISMTLKAFPEMAIDYGQIYHEPKPASQGYADGKSSD